MGKYYSKKKITVEECKKLSLSNLRKWGALNIGEHYVSKLVWGKGSLLESSIGYSVNQHNTELNVWYTKNKQSYNYVIPLISSNCNYGGVRYWLQCVECKGKVAKLYTYYSTPIFLCRHCLNLSYDSRNASKNTQDFDRLKASIKLDKIRNSISRCFYNGKPTKKLKGYVKQREKCFILE